MILSYVLWLSLKVEQFSAKLISSKVSTLCMYRIYSFDKMLQLLKHSPKTSPEDLGKVSFKLGVEWARKGRVPSNLFIYLFIHCILFFHFRRGSVIVLFNLTFTRDIADELGANVTRNLVKAVQRGSLGGLAVDPNSLTITQSGG